MFGDSIYAPPTLYALTQAHKLVATFFRKYIDFTMEKVPGVLGEYE